MITVGLINELIFISDAFKSPISVSVKVDKINHPILLAIDGDFLNLEYNGAAIWSEDIKSPSSLFGVESCDTIARILFHIDAGDEAWKDMCYKESH